MRDLFGTGIAVSRLRATGQDQLWEIMGRSDTVAQTLSAGGNAKMSIKEANKLKKHLTCLRCGRRMWTDRCHRICARCRRRDMEEPVRRPLSTWLPSRENDFDMAGKGSEVLIPHVQRRDMQKQNT